MACFYPNGTGICRNRACALDSCDSGFADCNAALGCETRLGTVDSCRTCGETCRNDHGTTSCETNGCVPVCQIGWGDCDGNKNNGCETPLDTLTNCGACGRTCATSHGRPSCATGTCDITSCDTGFDDCDGTVSNGCETPLNTLTDCGGCRVGCNLAHASESCGTGTCTLVSCDSGYRDCSAMQAGCETQLGTTSDCLGCGDACSNAHGTTSCNATTGCQPVCGAGFKSCDGDRGNGCERNIRTLTDCGDCDVDCDLANGAESCATGTCTLGTCTTGFANCDMNPGNGCETPLGTLSNCLSCGNACSNAHGTFSCNSSSGCQYGCATGWDSCDSNAANGCERSVWSLTDCGACGIPCDIPNSNETCGGGTCTATTCASGFAECVAGAPACETQLGTVANCRSCNEACTNAHGTTACSLSTGCNPACTTGWKSCDGIADNGCERDVRTLTSCGDCDVPCAFPHAAASCGTGTCTQGACDVGFADCPAAMQPGCETQLGTASNCASCGNACSNGHGTNSCTGMPGTFDCAPVCDMGWKSCNNDPDDGCETSVTTLTNCVNCGQACSFPNATASCSTGACTLTSCNAGFADCTAAAGCETTLGTTTACRSCTEVCSNAHGGTTCNTTNGCVPTCDAGWKSCDGVATNGCERDIRTLTSCGDCDVPCNFANASESCSTGTCTLGTCTAGFGNCDSQPANGCETTLGNVTHCNACGNACTNSHGSTSCTGTPGAFDCAPVCDANWASCNGNPDDGCETDLTTTSNCGICGRACSGGTPFCVANGGVYNCAAQLAISFVGDTDHQTGSLSSSFTHTLATGVGQARMVILALAENGNSTGSVPEIVTFNGTQMTMVGTPPGPFGNNQAFVAFFYLLDASLGGAGAKTIALDATGGQNNPTQIRANLLEFKGVNQTTPIDASFFANNGNCGTQHPIHSITTVTNNAFIVDVAAAFTGSAVTATPSGSLINTMSFVSTSPLAALAGYRGPVAPGTYSVGWTIATGGCNNSAHYIIALRP
jgi:hypothetical protein